MSLKKSKYKKHKGVKKSYPVKLPPFEFLNECFVYDETSPTFLRWKQRPSNHFANDKAYKIWNKKLSGMPVGRKNSTKYLDVSVVYNGFKYRMLVSRVIYALHNALKDISDKYIDHHDSNTLNNNIKNLRPISRSQNCLNRKKYKNFYPRVSFNNYRGMWHARFRKINFAYAGSAAEAYLVSWHFMLNDEYFKNNYLEYISKQEAEGFYAKAALLELGLPLDSVKLSLI
jgi:hypothetical protein